MERNFIWESKNIEGLPHELYVGVLFNNGMMMIFNENPDKEEFVMCREPINTELDISAVTSDWFTHEVTKDANKTYLNVVLKNPEVTEFTDDDMLTISHLQILDRETDTKVYLKMKVHSTMIHPEVWNHMYEKRHPESMNNKTKQETIRNVTREELENEVAEVNTSN